ncbi:MAG TPA: type II/IV secretion system protein, partial [Pseudomonadales bacterium]|nr:type II/IV secretion system protein [Pseudomonadales bacterium]
MGREGIYELLPMTDNIKAVVQESADVGKIRMAGMKEGMKTLRLSGALKVVAGKTTVDEVIRVAPLSGTE